MRLLYGTGNVAKLEVMKRRLQDLNIEIIGLQDYKQEAVPAPEKGNTPLENARQKAMCYYEQFKMPVFSCDSGLYIEGIPKELQPGVHVRTINGVSMTDEEMLDYYSGLAKQYGDLTARYLNAICLVLGDGQVYEAMDENMASEAFVITAIPHQKRRKGFPLDSISVDIKTGKYYYDLDESELDQVAVEDGFMKFFRTHVIDMHVRD